MLNAANGSGDIFKGRQVQEYTGFGTPHYDNCRYPDIGYPKWTSVTGLLWNEGYYAIHPPCITSNNEWGDDYVGWSTVAVATYRKYWATGSPARARTSSEDLIVRIARLRSAKAACLISLTVAAVASAAGQTTKRISATSGRPMWDSLDALEVSVGGTVNYEDVPIENSAECRDVSTPEWRASAPPGYRLMVPGLGTVTADIPLPANGAVTQNELIYDVNLLLASYRANHLPGDLHIDQANGMFYLTADKVLGADGAVHAVTSPMLTAITVPTADRSIGDTAQAIFDAVGKATGLQIGVATMPFWPSQHVTFGATQEVARDPLARLFAQVSSRPLSYRMNFEPKCDRMRAFDYVVTIAASGYVAPMAPAGYGPVNPPPGSAPQPPSPRPQPGAPGPNARPANPN